jgi:hypothetical protein
MVQREIIKKSDFLLKREENTWIKWINSLTLQHVVKIRIWLPVGPYFIHLYSWALCFGDVERLLERSRK